MGRLRAYHDITEDMNIDLGTSVAFGPTDALLPDDTLEAPDVAELITDMKAQGVKLIIVEPYFDTKTPQSIASQVGGLVLELAPSVGGDKEATDYLKLFDYDVNLLSAALKNITGK